MNVQLTAHLRQQQDLGVIKRITQLSDVLAHSMNNFLLWHLPSKTLYITTTQGSRGFYRRFRDSAVGPQGKFDRSQSALKFFMATTHYSDWEVYQSVKSSVKTFNAMFYQSFDDLQVVCRTLRDRHQTRAVENGVLYEIFHHVSGLTRWHYGVAGQLDWAVVSAAMSAIARHSVTPDATSMKINPRFKTMRALWLRGKNEEFVVKVHSNVEILRSGMGPIMYVQHKNQLEVHQERIDQRANAIQAAPLGTIFATPSLAPVVKTQPEQAPLQFKTENPMSRTSPTSNTFASVWDALVDKDAERVRMKNLSEAFYHFCDEVREKELLEQLTPSDQMAVEQGLISRFSFSRMLEVALQVGIDPTPIQALADSADAAAEAALVNG